MNTEISRVPHLIQKVFTLGSSGALIVFFPFSILFSYYFLVSPGLSYTNTWLNDTFALLDAAYRVSLGQIPGVDFDSALGPLNFFLSSIGLSIGLNAGVTFALGGIIAMSIVLLAGLLMMQRRFSLLVTLTVSTYIWLLMVVPLGAGQGYGRLSWGMFYNRHAWAAVFVVFLYYIEPRSIRSYDRWFDAISLAVLVLFNFYVKITYGLVSISFVLVNIVVSKYNRSVSIIAIAIIIISVLVLELIFGFHEGYFGSIADAIQSRSLYRSKLWDTISITLANSALLIAIIASLVMASLCKKLRPLDCLFAAGVCIVSFVLLDQNGGGNVGQPIALLAVFVCIGEKINRNTCSSFQVAPYFALTVYLLLCAFLAQPIGNRVIAWMDHYGRSKPNNVFPAAPLRLASYIVPSDLESSYSEFVRANNLSLEHNEAIRQHFVPTLTSTDYYKTIIDGARLLGAQSKADDVIFTLDNANPFPYILGVTPALGGSPFIWGIPPDAKEALKSVTIVMEPLKPYHYKTGKLMKAEYSSFLSNGFQKTANSKFWQLWSKSKGSDHNTATRNQKGLTPMTPKYRYQ